MLSDVEIRDVLNDSLSKLDVEGSSGRIALKLRSIGVKMTWDLRGDEVNCPVAQYLTRELSETGWHVTFVGAMTAKAMTGKVPVRWAPELDVVEVPMPENVGKFTINFDNGVYDES